MCLRYLPRPRNRDFGFGIKGLIRSQKLSDNPQLGTSLYRVECCTNIVLTPVCTVSYTFRFRDRFLASAPDRRHQIGLVFVDERINQEIDLAFKDLIQLIEGQIDAVIGHSALRKIIGADPFRAVARADEATPVFRLGGLLAFALGGDEPGSKETHRPRAVLMLGALILAFHHHPGG